MSPNDSDSVSLERHIRPEAVSPGTTMLKSILFLSTFSLALLPRILHAQENQKDELPKFNEFKANKREGWDWDKDERLDDLLQQLQEKELALQQVDARTAKLLGRSAGAKMDGNMAWRSTNRMDLKGGGPISWDAFYGRNAEKFFYHPVDPNTTYHTTTALQQVQPTAAGGVPGNQGVPAHQRPPQFDYIYRAYEQKQAKAKEDASEIASKLDVLKQRRQQLEQEVVLLWIKIAFRVQDREKVAERPILRWAVVPANRDDKNQADKAAALSDAAQLLAMALLFNEQQVERDPEKTFVAVSAAIQRNRKKFEDRLLKLPEVLDESEDKRKPIGQFKLLVRKLEDTSKSLSEGYRGWKDGDENEDEPTKYTGLRRVQDSVVTYSQILLALNELIDLMKKEWGLRISTDGTEFVPTWNAGDVPRTLSEPEQRPFAQNPSVGIAGASGDKPIERGLLWIASHQKKDGSWSFDHASCPGCRGQCGNAGSFGSKYSEAATALALLAFYRNGESHKQGAHKANVLSGIKYLAALSTNGNGRCSDNMYAQGCVSLALAECYRLTKDGRFRPEAQAALTYIQQSQDPLGGGWRYAPRQPGDTSATGWQLAALIAGKSAGLSVPPATLAKVDSFLNSMQAQGGSAYGYTGPGDGKGTTAVGLYCRALMGWRENHPPMRQGLNRLIQLGPNADLYFDYYASQATRTAGEESLTAWKRPMESMLVGAQSGKGHSDGSWFEGVEGGHGAQVGGRLYCTSLALMILAAVGQ